MRGRGCKGTNNGDHLLQQLDSTTNTTQLHPVHKTARW